MRHVTPLSAVVVTLVVLAACRDNAVQPTPPFNATIRDGNHSGNANFFFLPPLVASPVGTANYDPGKFNAKLLPFVEVCILAGDPLLGDVECQDNGNGAPNLVFGPARMSLDASNEQYLLNWDTKASLLDAASFYRITVRGSAQGTPLGFLDVDPVLGGMKNAKTPDVFVFQDGRTLPIKVRIEQGAFGSSNSNDAVEQVVPSVIPSGTLDVTTNTGFAGARFTSGWLPSPIEQVVVIIERIPINNGASETTCLESGLEELEGCYRFRTDPDLHGLGPEGGDLLFQIPVIAGVCFQYPGEIEQENGHPFQLHRRGEVVIEGQFQLIGTTVPLQEVSAPFLRCDGFGPTTPSIGAALRSRDWGEFARAGWFSVSRALARVMQPKALHAVDLGAGGNTNEFSRFGFARNAAISVTEGDGAIAPAGSTIDASVQVQNIHHDDTSGVAGQSVTFTVTVGDGTLSHTEGETTTCDEVTTCTVTTDGEGNATVSWRLGQGENTLTVETAQVTNSPQFISATGTAAQPELAYRHSEQFSVEAVNWDRYALTVTNRSAFPASMFAPAPDLPPCGLNTNSSQSWVDIYDGATDARIYGFCALASPNELNDLWFAIPRWEQPPSSVYITITDRRANVVYTSNRVSLFGPLFVNVPRLVELNWSAVPGAVSYEIEMQYCVSWASPDWRTCNVGWTLWTHLLSYTAGISYVDTFVGDQPGRWRVRANDGAGNPIGAFTPYTYFNYITSQGAQ